MSKKKKRVMLQNLEMQISYGDGTWDTDFVRVPASNSERKLEDAGREAIMKTLSPKANVSSITLYCSNDDQVGYECQECKELCEEMGSGDLCVDCEEKA